MRSLLLCAFSLLLGVAYSKSIIDAANKDDTLLKAKFKTRDTEGDGRISRSDLRARVHRIKNRADGGLSLDLVNLINNQFEADGDGRIPKSDLRTYGHRIKNGADVALSLDLVNLINNQFEVDGDGRISKSDVRAGGLRIKNRADGGLSLDLVNLIKNQFETDGDGNVFLKDGDVLVVLPLLLTR